MANYASLWTSASDKEFRQISKFHSLQRRRLGQQMVGIQREHARHVKRARVEIREAGTLIQQYENEKEQRARHLLRTFSKVQKRRQATQSWKEAHQRRASSVAAPSATFEVEIGEEGAPWGGGRRRGSQQSELSSRRKSSTSSLGSFSTTSRPSWANVLGRKTVTLSPHLPRRQQGPSRLTPKLPPLGHRGHGYQPQKTFPGFLNPWRDMAQGSQGKEEKKDETEGVEDKDYGVAEERSFLHKGNRKGSGSVVHCGTGDCQPRRQIFWTETFPYVYHSVGETVCPRYSLFLQYEEYKVRPQQKTRGKRSSVTSTMSTTSRSDVTPHPLGDDKDKHTSPSFKTVGKAVSMVNAFNSLSAGQSDPCHHSQQ